jgi:histidinol-phosphate phosphatase family protein
MRLKVALAYLHHPQLPVARAPGVAPLSSLPVGHGLPMSEARRSGPRPGILLDRDGTIIVDHGYVGSVDRVEFIDEAPEAIARFNRVGIPVAVVTSQVGVARGLYGIDDVRQVHRYIAERLADYGARIDLFLYCPYHPDGMIEDFDPSQRGPQAEAGHGQGIGARAQPRPDGVLGDGRPAEDISLAEAIRASAVYMGTDGRPRPGAWSFPSLAAAAPFLMERIAV